MSYLKAKEYLEKQKSIFSKTMHPEMTYAMHKAISALDKQVSKKPIDKNIGYGDKALSCPECENPVTNYWKPTTRPVHCQFCGQALDWGNTK